MKMSREALAGILIITAIVVCVLVGATVVTTEVGYVTIVIDPVSKQMWTVGDGTTAGWYFWAKPIWATTVMVYVSVDSVHMWTEVEKTGDFPAVPCLTKDGLGVEVDITVRWRLAASKVLDLYRNYPGLDWKERVIIPAIREAIRDVIVRFTAIETIEKRATIAAQLFSVLEESLKAEKTVHGAIILDSLDLREIALPAKFVEAIEEKLAAEQLMIAAEYRAAQILIMAQAEADAAIIKAEAAAQIILIKAEATAEAIQRIAEETNMTAAEIAQLYMILDALKEIANSQGKTVFLVVVGENGLTYMIPVTPEDQS
jgi:regulator of protease activity HflC (stomatin/prohibitin superfamily)